MNGDVSEASEVISEVEIGSSGVTLEGAGAAVGAASSDTVADGAGGDDGASDGMVDALARDSATPGSVK